MTKSTASKKSQQVGKTKSILASFEKKSGEGQYLSYFALYLTRETGESFGGQIEEIKRCGACFSPLFVILTVNSVVVYSIGSGRCVLMHDVKLSPLYYKLSRCSKIKELATDYITYFSIYTHTYSHMIVSTATSYISPLSDCYSSLDWYNIYIVD